MGNFREGFATGTQAGGFGAFFETLKGELSKAQKRREEEDIRRKKEDTERRKEEFQLQGAIEKIVATGKQARETAVTTEEEERKTKREFPDKGLNISVSGLKAAQELTTGKTPTEIREPVGFLEKAGGFLQKLIPGTQKLEGRLKTREEQIAKEEKTQRGTLAGIQEKFLGQFQQPEAKPTTGKRIKVRLKSTGETGTIEEQEFDSTIYDRL